MAPAGSGTWARTAASWVSSNSLSAFAALALTVVLLSPPPASASDALWQTLRAGGNVVLVRHATTDPGVGDPSGFKLNDCSTQRNLNEAGRAEARRLGAAFRKHGIPVSSVRSSRWCRCIDTAILAFGKADPWPALDNTFETPERRPAQMREVTQAMGKKPARGNLVLVTHGVNIAALTGIHVAQGEIVIVHASGNNGFKVAGRLSPAY